MRLLTPLEVSEMLRIPVATLYRWRYVRKGPPALKLGRHLRYSEDVLLEWLRGQQDHPGAGHAWDS